MKKFTCVQDIGNLTSALNEAFEIKKDRFKYVELGRNKTLLMIFFNSSLRTRTSTKAPGNWKPSVASSWTVTNPSICWRPFP